MSIFGPSWFQKKGLGVGNLPTCDVLWSCKAVMSINTGLPPDNKWYDNPAYMPFQNGGPLSGETKMTDDGTGPWAFARWLVYSNFKRATMYINDNDIGAPFTVKLARDGPVADGGITGPPIPVRTIFNIPAKTDPAYKVKNFYNGPDVEMFSDHSYAFVLEITDDSVTFPTTASIDFVIMSAIYFGGAGD